MFQAAAAAGSSQWWPGLPITEEHTKAVSDLVLNNIVVSTLRRRHLRPLPDVKPLPPPRPPPGFGSLTLEAA